jgi:Xaa-Pro aminopeptidase
LGRIVLEAFKYAAANLLNPVNEHQVAEFIRTRFEDEGLTSPDGPIVAVNEHGSDPHYLPQSEGSSPIQESDWLLIDLWAKELDSDSVYADITWVAYMGAEVPTLHREIFDVVTGARDAALEFLQSRAKDGQSTEGWEADTVARRYIQTAGYGDYFTHRLGHSLGTEVHGEAVNLDGFETYDTRTILPGIGFTIEPGIYLPQFGMRSEIDVFMHDSGPQATTSIQREVVLIPAH